MYHTHMYLQIIANIEGGLVQMIYQNSRQNTVCDILLQAIMPHLPDLADSQVDIDI